MKNRIIEKIRAIAEGDFSLNGTMPELAYWQIILLLLAQEGCISIEDPEEIGVILDAMPKNASACRQKLWEGKSSGEAISRASRIAQSLIAKSKGADA